MIYGVLRGRPDRWVREEGDATPSGFTTAAHGPDDALDYVRAPLFDWTKGRASGRASSAV